MNDWRKWRRGLLAFMVLSLAGCVFLPAPLKPIAVVPENLIGTLGVSGGGVMINGENAGNGDAVTAGDTIATGPGTSAVMDFLDGGYIHLDQNTKVIFAKKRLYPDMCVLADILVGQAFIDRAPLCLQTPHLEGVSNAMANVSVTPEQTELVVVQRTATIDWPKAIVLKQFQKFTATTVESAAKVVNMTELMALEVTGWRRAYSFQGWCCKRSFVIMADRDRCDLIRFSFSQAAVTGRCKKPLDVGL